MATWSYKATRKKAGPEFTESLARHDRFLARAAHLPTNKLGKNPHPSNAWRVEVGDIIHIYYVGGPKYELGSFRVIDPSLAGPGFQPALNGQCFASVIDPVLIKKLQDEKKYAQDPILKTFVGWALELQSELRQPKYTPALFKGSHTLCPVV